MINTWNEDVILKRKAAGSYVNGRWVEGAETSTTIRATVQPPSPDELQILEEGLRSRKPILVHSASEMRTANVGNATSPDIISYNGEDYEVQQVERWTQMLPHYKALCLRLEEGSRD